MQERTLQAGNHITLLHLPQKKYFHLWLLAADGLKGQEAFRSEIRRVVQYCLAHQAKGLLINIKDFQANIPLSLKNWLLQEAFFYLRRSSLKRIAIVFGANVHHQVLFEEILGNKTERDFSVASFTSEPEAIVWCQQSNFRKLA
ncbi:MAG: hypothetical protein HC913_19515 [Microscillaceae bacterium]|nr:hypothetical protein [Microscillaceae bacterium]